MSKNKAIHLLFGVGEVGSALKKILITKTTLYWFDKNPKIKNNLPAKSDRIDVAHISFPQSRTFISEVRKLIEKYNPQLVVIHSTTIPGTTMKLGKNCVHSPVVGQHDKLYKHIKTFKKAVGPNSKSAIDLSKKYLSSIFTLEFYKDSKTTEAGKVLSLAKFAINIELARYSKEFCQDLSIDFKEAYEKFTSLYNEGYEKNGLKKFIQPLLNPPTGKIGGSCVIPGVKKAQIILKSKFFNGILKSKKKI